MEWYDEKFPGQENDDETGYHEWRRGYVASLEAKEQAKGEPMAEIQLNRWYKHKNGNLYRTLMFANEDSQNLEKYPVMIVYIGANGKTWARRVDKWHGSFTILT